jgi:hypothetical protein
VGDFLEVLMKDTAVPPPARWGGNPAEEIEAPPRVAPVRPAHAGDGASVLVPQPPRGGRHRGDGVVPRTPPPWLQPDGRQHPEQRHEAVR